MTGGPGEPVGLAGKVIVVTGAANGQGRAEALLLARLGAEVIATDRDPAQGEERLDVTDAAGWTRLAASVRDRFGVVHGLVNNAGSTWRARLDELDRADLERVMAVNLTGPLLGIQHLTPLMTAGGSIVNVGSVAALTGHYPVAYTASKWALRGLTKAACLELGPRGIRVNLIHPGFVQTAMTATAAPAFRAANLAETPLGRTGTVHDVAPLVAFLLGDGASWISGAEIPVDGGMTAHGGVRSLSEAMRG
jgi:3alpha(or 20beta)-hydroxysteroid dehydrogenase